MGVVAVYAGLASAQDQRRDRDNMRRQAVEWFKAVNSGGAYGPMVPGVSRKVGSAMEEGRHAYIILPGDLSKTGRAHYGLTWAGAFHAFELTSDQARRMGISAGSVVTGSGARRSDVRAPQPLVQLNELRIERADNLPGDQPITGSVKCQALDSHVWGSLVLRLSYKTKGSTTEVTSPFSGLPVDGVLKIKVDAINGDRAEPHEGPLPVFVDVCRENGVGHDRTLTVISNTLAVLLDVQSARPSLMGTTWRFNGTETTIDFLSGGRIRYKYGFSESSGQWEQRGDKVTFDTEGYTLFELTLSGNSMSGTWRRLKGSDVGTTAASSMTKIGF
jgi:hypothetical protein